MYYLKEWEDSSVTLMTDEQSLWTFNSLYEAYTVCREMYDLGPEFGCTEIENGVENS